MNKRIKASLISISTDIFLIATKSTLAALSGSAALLADAYHSLSDLFVSLAVLSGSAFRSWMEKRELLQSTQAESAENENSLELQEVSPAKAEEDEDSPPAKPGYWVEAGITYIISLIILYLPYEIISGISKQKKYDLEYTWLAIIGVIACIVITYFISRYKLLAGREVDSPALVADGYHSRMDMFTSVAVLFSMLGQIIGIKLDPLVAVVIAVMIGIVGLELFITSVVALARKSGLKRLSLFAWLYEQTERVFTFLAGLFVGKQLKLSDLHLAERLSPERWYSHRRLAVLVVVFVSAYFLSGLTMIRPEETGVKLRFGHIENDHLQPGLTYRLPWPFESIKRIRMQEIRRVEFGFRTDDRLNTSISPTLWETKHGTRGYKKKKKESITLTGDENIIDISLVLHYRPTNPIDTLFRVNRMDNVLRGLLESSLRKTISVRKADSLLVENRQEALNAILDDVRAHIKQLDLGVEAMALYCHDLHPPLEVVGAFRDVFSAREEKIQLLNNAETHRNTALPEARSKSYQSLHEAQADRIERREKAIGDAKNFALVSKAYRRQPKLTAYRMFIEMAEIGMAGKRKIIADPEVNRGGYRLWMFAPENGNALNDLKGLKKGVNR